MTVPLTKVSNHILVLQTQIVLDRQTDRQTDVFCVKNPCFSVQREQQKKLMLLTFLSIPIRGKNPNKPGTKKAFGFYSVLVSPVLYIAGDFVTK